MLADISLFVDKREVKTELITKSTFVSGQCKNNFVKATKPQIYFLSRESVWKHHGIPSIAVVLEQCLGERAEKDVVIMCNSLLDVNRAVAALNVLETPSVEYTPHLRKTIPSSAQKQVVLNEISCGSDTILVSEYRAFRGCEASHCIIFTDLQNPIPGNIMAEMLSRTMVYLDFIVLPRKENTPGVHPFKNIIESTFEDWKTHDWVEMTTVVLHDEDESSISFDLQDLSQSIKSELIEIKIPETGFILPESAESQGKMTYL